MDKFTASNGVELSRTNGGKTLFLESPGDSWPNPEEHGLLLNADFEPALREFFRAEEDERLGRWRWNDYVVYHHGDWLTLVHEADGTKDRISVEWARTEVTDDPSRANVQYAAIAWAHAHPEPKPWHNAQHDEIWALTTPAAGERPYQVVRTEEAGFRFFLISDHEGFRPGLFPDEAQITAGRRIYPEGNS